MTPERIAEIRRRLAIDNMAFGPIPCVVSELLAEVARLKALATTVNLLDAQVERLAAEIERLSTCDVWVSVDTGAGICEARIPASAIVRRGA